jgi:hypothetical protein
MNYLMEKLQQDGLRARFPGFFCFWLSLAGPGTLLMHIVLAL